MKLTNFKMYPLILAASALLALSGCDGSKVHLLIVVSGTEVPAPTPDAGTSTVIANPIQ